MPLQLSKYNWLIRYKLYHIPFWAAYHYFWWVVGTGNATGAFKDIITSPYGIKFFSYVLFQAIGVYINLYFLIPRFLEKGKYKQYIALLLLTIIGTGCLIAMGYYLSVYWSGSSFKELYQMDTINFFTLFKNNALPSTVASTTLAMSVKLTKNWITSKTRQQLLEKEKTETELKFLRSQFNPHFLFNTINSIFVLIHKNPDMASDSLAKFSDLMRYQLYECNEAQIPLKQELAYLENFIELQKLRHDHDNLEVSTQFDHHYAGNLAIAPFVLIPFIENAFKHVSNEKGKRNWIKMRLTINQEDLHFDISNSTSPAIESSNEILEYHGIGLKNVQRRLDLIYPGKHHFDVIHNDHQFRATLRLHLHETKTPEYAEMRDN
jgi:sensor histidine kinase YesM